MSDNKKNTEDQKDSVLTDILLRLSVLEDLLLSKKVFSAEEQKKLFLEKVDQLKEAIKQNVSGTIH